MNESAGMGRKMAENGIQTSLNFTFYKTIGTYLIYVTINLR